MNPEFFGDSYDFVKKEIINGLAPAEDWAVHPMYFSEDPTEGFVESYSRFLGVGAVEGCINDRDLVPAVSELCRKHLFLDPDTGLWVPGVGVEQLQPGGGWDRHLRVEEVGEIAIAPERERMLTLIFDQSYPRRTLADRRILAEQKLGELRQGYGVHGVGYVTHVVFMWFCHDEDVLAEATRKLVEGSRLPRCRLVGDIA